MDEIKTEVDRLIDLLKTGAGKPMRLSELASLTGLTVPQTRKWIHILEERRQVRVRYNLAEEQVEWMASVPSSSGHVRSPPPSTFSAEPPAEPGDNAADLNVEMARYNERRYRTAHRVPQDEAAQMEVPKPPVSEHEASGVRLPPERTFHPYLANSFFI